MNLFELRFYFIRIPSQWYLFLSLYLESMSVENISNDFYNTAKFSQFSLFIQNGNILLFTEASFTFPISSIKSLWSQVIRILALSKIIISKWKLMNEITVTIFMIIVVFHFYEVRNIKVNKIKFSYIFYSFN